MDKINMINYQQYVLKEKFGKKLEKPMSFSPSSFRIRRAKFHLTVAAAFIFLALLIGVYLYG